MSTCSRVAAACSIAELQITLSDEQYNIVKAALTALPQTTNARAFVWFERFHDVKNAIIREKQIKRWRREKKIALIKQENPTWVDLSEEWSGTAGPSTALRYGRDDNSVW